MRSRQSPPVSQRISWPALISACLLAVLVRIAWDLTVHAVPISDFLYYYEHGIGLALGRGYTNAGIPTAFWPPGYSLFLAGVFKAFGQTLAAAKASSIALWTLSTALAYILGLRLGGRSTAALSAFIVALFPEFILFANLTASENLFAPLILGALIALCPRQDMKHPPSWQRMAVAGLLLGCSVVVRPTSVLLPFAAYSTDAAHLFQLMPDIVPLDAGRAEPSDALSCQSDVVSGIRSTFWGVSGFACASILPSARS